MFSMQKSWRHSAWLVNDKVAVTMRRNTVTILKYLVLAALFLTLGPVPYIKLMFGDADNELHIKRVVHVPQGLPVGPDDMQPAVVSIVVLVHLDVITVVLL